MLWWSVLLCALLCVLLCASLVRCDDDNDDSEDPITMSDEKRLIKKLLDDYEKVGVIGRPVYDTSQTINVSYGLSLIQILDLDEKNQVLTTNVWSKYKWQDIMLKWNPDDYGGLSAIRVPTSKIWKPDIVLYNFADQRLKEQREALAVVESTGYVDWLPTSFYMSTCSVDIDYFPFDIQNCHLKFGSWTHNGLFLDLVLHDDSKGLIELTDYQESNEWMLLSYPAKKNVIYYHCCPETYVDLTFYITIKRIPFTFMFTLIIPCFLLSILALVSFWLPPESAAKILLNMNLFLAFFLLLKILSVSTPASSSIPLIGVYFCINMVMLTSSSFISATIMNISKREDKKNKVPKWLRKIAIDGFSKILRLEQRKNVQRLKKSRRNHVTHHITHVIDGTTNSRKSHHEKTIKSPVLPYNKWEPPSPQGGTVAGGNGAGNRDRSNSGRIDSPILSKPPPIYCLLPAPVAMVTTGDENTKQQPQQAPFLCYYYEPKLPTPPPQPPSFVNNFQSSIENEVKDVKKVLKNIMAKMQAKDNKEKNAVEWRLVALAIDRMFFIMYLATIMVSTATILVMCFVYYTSHEAVQAGAYYIHGMNKSEYMAGYEEWMDE